MIVAASVGPYGAALIGAVGAVIGGVLTSGSNLLIDHSRAKREAKVSAEEEQAELLQAGRPVLEELSEIDAALQQAIRSGYTWPADRLLQAFAWHVNRFGWSGTQWSRSSVRPAGRSRVSSRTPAT